jgi:hypothetical protein
VSVTDPSGKRHTNQPYLELAERLKRKPPVSEKAAKRTARKSGQPFPFPHVWHMNAPTREKPGSRLTVPQWRQSALTSSS